MLDPQIIFEDDFLVVIDKPAGVVVNRAGTTAKTETVQDWAESRIEIGDLRFENVSPEVREEFTSRGGIGHRLDKDTSGLLVIAKTPEAFSKLKEQFKGREVVKKYLALVHGKVEPAEGTVDAPISRSPFNRKHFGVFPGGRPALTKFKVRKYLKGLKALKSGEVFSLLEVEPKTGRTHQIRVHMKYVGHPIVSDPIYGGRKQVREDLKWCPRLFLHAAKLAFSHPVAGEDLSFEAPLTEELALVLGKLRG